MQELQDPPSVVTYDVRPKAQRGGNRPPVPSALGAQHPEIAPLRAQVRPIEADGEEDGPLTRGELVTQIATVAGYALGGAALFQLGSWMVAAL